MRILVPSDFSANSLQALKFAAFLAEKIPVELTIINVFGHLTGTGTPSQNSSLYGGTALAKEDALKSLVSSICAAEEYSILRSIPVHYMAKCGLEEEVIIEEAAAGHFDLILMGTRGAGRNINQYWGSVSRKVSAKSSVPVLLMPMEYQFHNIKKIIFAQDFMDYNENELEYVVRFKRWLNAELIILHITEMEDYDNNVRTINYHKMRYVFGMKNENDHIQYEFIRGMNDKKKAVMGFVKSAKGDVLSLVKRKTHVDNEIEESLTLQIMQDAHIPLLVFNHAPNTNN